MHLLRQDTSGIVVGSVFLLLLGTLVLGSGIGASHALPAGAGDTLTAGRDGSAKSTTPLDSPRAYTISFSETGLPAQALWQVATITALTGFVVSNTSNSTVLTQAWANGTYSFTASADLVNFTTAQVNASFTVSGTEETVPVRFFPAHPVTFSETGLPTHFPWSVLIQGNGTVQNETGSGPTIALLVPVGPFNYTVYADEFNATPTSGMGTVSAAPVGLSVSFTAILPPVGYLSGICTVGSAAMYIDGLRSNVHLGGGFSIALEPGFHSIIVTATGYVSFYDEVVIASGNTTNVYIALQGINDTYYNSTAVPGIDNTGWIIIGALAGGVVIFGVVAAVYANRAKSATRAASKPKP